jgi:hypothetical protein
LDFGTRISTGVVGSPYLNFGPAFNLVPPLLLLVKDVIAHSIIKIYNILFAIN